MLRASLLLGLLAACSSAPAPVGVAVNGLGLTLGPLRADCGVGRIRSLTPLDHGDLLICGERGAVRRTAAGAFEDRIQFAEAQAHAVPLWLGKAGAVRAPGSVEPHYADLGGGWADVDLLDSAGRTLWTRPGQEHTASADCLASGDLDGDGDLEFAIGYNGSGGLELVDHGGRTIWWRRAGNVFSAAICDLDGDGGNELIHSSTGHGLVVRDAGGEVLWTVGRQDGHFTLFNWPALAAGPLIGVTHRGVRFDVLSPRGDLLLSWDLPGSGHSVSHALSRGSQLTLTRTLGATERRSELLIFSAADGLLYHQVFANSYLAPARSHDPQAPLWLGAGAALWSHAPSSDQADQRGTSAPD